MDVYTFFGIIVLLVIVSLIMEYPYIFFVILIFSLLLYLYFDKKEMEGVKSTGANKLQQNRFGIFPQILPVFISQTLYYLESNTRGAIVVGAMGAGGIGLQFLGALQTGKDWENVAYISFLVLLMVVLIDVISAKLRRKLIG